MNNNRAQIYTELLDENRRVAAVYHRQVAARTDEEIVAVTDEISNLSQNADLADEAAWQFASVLGILQNKGVSDEVLHAAISEAQAMYEEVAFDQEFGEIIESDKAYDAYADGMTRDRDVISDETWESMAENFEEYDGPQPPEPLTPLDFESFEEYDEHAAEQQDWK